jgi:hypothetical protein
MIEQAIASRCGLGRLLSCAGIAALAISGPAHATVSIEYGQDYEDAYLTACAASQPPDVCACQMTAIEDAMSSAAFAEAVQRTGGDLRGDAIWSRSASAISIACFGADADFDEEE